MQSENLLFWGFGIRTNCQHRTIPTFRILPLLFRHLPSAATAFPRLMGLILCRSCASSVSIWTKSLRSRTSHCCPHSMYVCMPFIMRQRGVSMPHFAGLGVFMGSNVHESARAKVFLLFLWWRHQGRFFSSPKEAAEISKPHMSASSCFFGLSFWMLTPGLGLPIFSMCYFSAIFLVLKFFFEFSIQGFVLFGCWEYPPYLILFFCNFYFPIFFARLMAESHLLTWGVII